MTQIPDSALVSQTLQGDPGGFEALARRYQPALMRYFRLYHSVEDATDLVQETFLQAWRGIARYDSRWCFSTWLYTIAWRQSGMLLRRKLRDPTRRRPEKNVELEEIPLNANPAPGFYLEQDEERKNLWTKIASILPQAQTDVLWLFYVEEKSLREIAFIQKRTVPGVKTLLFRARKTLQKLLK